MQEPSVRNSRLAITAGLVSIIALGFGGFVVGRATAPQAKPPQTVAQVLPKPPSLSPAPQLPRILTRAEILDLAARAVDIYASSGSIPENFEDAVGQRFDLALPFGCTGSTPDGSKVPMQWRYQSDGGVLRIQVMPVLWTPADWNMESGHDALAIQGFWIAQPWSSDETCPRTQTQAADTGPAAAMSPSETLAVAEFARDDGQSILQRGGRPFQKIARIAPETFDGTRGFRLRLIGRIGRVPGGGPAHCIQPTGMEQQPVCVVAIEVDEVRVEAPDTSTALAIWETRTPKGRAPYAIERP